MSDKLSLYNVAEEIAALDDLVGMEDGEWTPEIEALAEELALKSTHKADSFAAYLREIERLEEVARAEEVRLAKRRNTLKNRRESLKRYAVMAILKTGRPKITGDLRTLAIQPNARKLETIAPVEALPTEFLVVVPGVPEKIIPAIPESFAADEDKILAALKAIEGKLDDDGQPLPSPVPGCTIAPQTYHLRIR